MTNYRVPVLEHFTWQVPVITRTLSTPPISPAPVKNDRYIVKATGTGDWASHDNEIAYYDGSIWKFTVPTEGFILWVNDENTYYSFDGAAWNVFSSGTPVITYYPRWILGGM